MVQFLEAQRLGRAGQLLQLTSRTVAEIAADVGFRTRSTFPCASSGMPVVARASIGGAMVRVAGTCRGMVCHALDRNSGPAAFRHRQGKL